MVYLIQLQLCHKSRLGFVGWGGKHEKKKQNDSAGDFPLKIS